MDEDDNFVNKRSAVKSGRRAKKEKEAAMEEEGSQDMAADEVVANNDSRPTRAADAPPRPARRMGGWGDDSKAGRRRGMTEDPYEDERLRPTSPDKSDDEDNDIPVIPDLDDAQEEDFTTQIALAPNVAINRVATFRELDNDLLRHAPFLTLDNEIDLKILSRCLSAEHEVNEEDKQWDWDRLFTEVTSELSSEWEKQEAPEEKEKETAST